MTLIVFCTLFALGVARLAGAPRGTWRYVLGVAVGLALATQLLPPAHPLRRDVAESSYNLAWVALALVPVALYAFGLRRLRQRADRDRPSATATAAAPLRGLVQIAEDAALVGETEAARAQDAARALGRAPRSRSLGWRGEDGALEGHLQLAIFGETGEILSLRIFDPAREAEVGPALVRGAETLGLEMGARRLVLRAGNWEPVGFLPSLGYEQVGEEDLAPGARWIWLRKELA